MGGSGKYTMRTQNSHQSVAGMVTKAKTDTWRFPLVNRLKSMWVCFQVCSPQGMLCSIEMFELSSLSGTLLCVFLSFVIVYSAPTDKARLLLHIHRALFQWCCDFN